jgi:hypothetical protein
MATINETPSSTWKAVIRKHGWPTTIKTFHTKRDTEDWAQRTEDDMVRGVFIDHAGSDRLLLKHALDRYLREVSSTKKPSTHCSLLFSNILCSVSLCLRVRYISNEIWVTVWLCGRQS